MDDRREKKGTRNNWRERMTDCVCGHGDWQHDEKSKGCEADGCYCLKFGAEPVEDGGGLEDVGFEIGDKVKILELECTGRVIAILMDFYGVRVEVRYFHNGEAHNALFFEDELEEVKE